MKHLVKLCHKLMDGIVVISNIIFLPVHAFVAWLDCDANKKDTDSIIQKISYIDNLKAIMGLDGPESGENDEIR